MERGDEQHTRLVSAMQDVIDTHDPCIAAMNILTEARALFDKEMERVNELGKPMPDIGFAIKIGVDKLIERWA